MPRVVNMEWWHELAFPKNVVWPILSQTDRFNRAAGLPPISYQLFPELSGGGRARATARFLGLALRWREHPFEWMEGQYYHVRRVFEGGPFAEGRMGMEFQDGPDGGTRIRVFNEVTARGRVGEWLAATLLKRKLGRDIDRIIQHVKEFLAGRVGVALPRLALSPVKEGALAAGIAALERGGVEPGLVSRMERWLRETPDADLSHVRPFEAARLWGMDRWDVLSLFMRATRAGLTRFSWELLCPNCRSSRTPPAESLSELKSEAHCDVCQIKYDGQFDESVELKFSVHPSVRDVPDQTFCLAGPGGRRHIISQLTLRAGESRSWPLPAGLPRCRLRSPQAAEPLDLAPEARDGRLGRARLVVRPERLEWHSAQGGEGSPILMVENPNPFEAHLSLEQLDWSDEILTAARATNLQEFRDLFVREVIAPGEQFAAGRQVILFTDLRGSTALYQAVGDARAFALVRRHFEVLKEAIASQRGVLIKTIGDAVMAAFTDPREAMAAVERMHGRIGSVRVEGADASLVLKAGLHAGSCLALNANDRLDYFGTAVNLAARLVGFSEGGDLVFSSEVGDLPEVAAYLAGRNVEVERFEAQPKGFDTLHTLCRARYLPRTEARA